MFSTDAFAAPNTSSWLTALLSWFIPGIEPQTIASLHGAVRKLGHFSEYFILARLFGNAWKIQWPRQSGVARCISVIVAATLYAISDEWHQSFVPSRSASTVDVTIDACGAICGALWTWHRSDTAPITDSRQQVRKKT
jgi:VanZ family protein